jgi:phage antirepressor YoqD-like protein
MQDLTISAAATMSSREIAELTGKDHKHVLQDVRNMLDQLGMTLAEFSANLPDAYGRPQPVYMLPKELTITLVSGYSVVMRHRIVTRWQELEAGAAPKLPQTFAEALRLAAEQAEQIEQQAQALALAAPKVEFVDRYVTADSGAKGLREVCKILRANERHFTAFLNARQIMYRLGGHLVPYAPHIDAGRFIVKTGEAHGHAFTTAKFTPKGVEWVAGEWAKWQLIGEAA